MTAKALGFAMPTPNSLDSVSDRDFALDYLMAAAQCSLHLSRLAEEFIIWASQPFGFVSLPDAYSTGSSIMPQKRNPDAAELVRGKSGRILGDLQALLVVLKGLPLANLDSHSRMALPEDLQALATQAATSSLPYS